MCAGLRQGRRACRVATCKLNKKKRDAPLFHPIFRSRRPKWPPARLSAGLPSGPAGRARGRCRRSGHKKMGPSSARRRRPHHLLMYSICLTVTLSVNITNDYILYHTIGRKSYYKHRHLHYALDFHPCFHATHPHFAMQMVTRFMSFSANGCTREPLLSTVTLAASMP